ncbi:MAG: HEPN domain-containing protein [Nanoarchaeota archaeon]
MVRSIDFFNERKLRKIAPDLNKSRQSLKIAESKLAEAKELLRAEFYSQAMLSAYTSMFHSARAILYKEGIQEKSHYAVYIYLKENYSNLLSGELLESFLNHQNERKEILYGLDYNPNKNEAESSIEDAELFFVEVTGIL